MLKIASEISIITDGKYDVTIAPLIRLWGFGTDSSNHLPSAIEISNALTTVGINKYILLDQQMALSTSVHNVDIDLSSVAKGIAADTAADVFLKSGLSNFLINAGGEIRVSSTGEKVWQIGIQVPLENSLPDEFIKERILKLENAGIATSGNYRNYFKDGSNTYSHIINPVDGKPIKTKTLSVTVIAEKCGLADAWATGLFTIQADKAVKLADSIPDIECLIIERPDASNEGFKYYYSANFPIR